MLSASGGHRVVFITGAGSGIGRAAVRAFARAGADVVVVDIAERAAAETVQLVAGLSGRALAVQADVSVESDVARAIELTISHFGQLDWAFNNAGIAGPHRQELDVDTATYERVMDVNVKGVWLCMKHEVAAMRRGAGGVIVNNASDAGLVGSASRPLYSASKHAVVGLTRSSALIYAKDKIRINAVCAGAVDTPMVADFVAASPNPAKLKDEMQAANPMRRIAQPEEIAAAALWLCSDAASFVTGHALVIDGGATAGSR